MPQKATNPILQCGFTMPCEVQEYTHTCTDSAMPLQKPLLANGSNFDLTLDTAQREVSKLTVRVNVSCFVFFATKKSSSGFLKEILRGAGQVEIWDRVAAAGRKPVRREALWSVRGCQNAAGDAINSHGETDPGDTPTCKKNSCRMMSSSRGRSSGFLDNMLAIKCLAGASKDEGRVYLASLMHRYVSFRFVVSNGGLPSNIVYLGGRKCLFRDGHRATFSSTKVQTHICFCSLGCSYSHDTAQRPDVRLAAVPLLVEDFGGEIVWGPTYGSAKTK